MRSLVLLLDSGAPSFCYYQPAAGAGSSLMSERVLEQALDFAREQQLALQVIGRSDGVPRKLRERLRGQEHVCYVAADAAELGSEDVPVLEAGRDEQLRVVAPGRHLIAILRVPRSALLEWPDAFRQLARRVQRVVLVPLGLPRWDQAELARYQQSLAIASEHLRELYLGGHLVELSAISDRFVLDAATECSAGIDHLTVAPGGELHLCPAFALEGTLPLGRVGSLPQIPNAQLLRRDHAPICALCDAHHCRRCLHLNRSSTLELNTPPWQLCRAVHLEREAGRLLLGRLQAHGLLPGLPAIPAVPYQDPFEALTGRKLPAPEPPRFASLELPSRRGAEGEPGQTEQPRSISKESPMDKGTPVGKVSPEERDEIRDLFLRKTALTELFLSLAKLDAASLESTPLYHKVVRDMGEVTARFQSWWEEKAQRYGWKGRAGGSWNIDFDSCEVFLV